ncbi:MAG TPA: acyltransferase, partial [Tepidisphaeraceae bacterium]
MAKNNSSNASPEAGVVLSHMPAIDGLRGIAILIVMIHHLTPAVSGSLFTRRMLEVAHTGWIGVDLFFVLSGFLITAILLRTRSSEDYFINFFARRTLRIFPLYYITLGVLLLGVPALMTMPHVGHFMNEWFGRITRDLQVMLDGQSWLWMYGTNLKIAIEGERWGAVNHFWSLAVEEHFYLVWPIVVYYASRAGLIKICMICILGAPVLRAMLMLAGFDSVVPYVLTPCRVDSLAM